MIKRETVKVIKEIARPEEIIEAIGDGISIQDTNYIIVYQNEMHKTLFGNHTDEHCYKAYRLRDNEACAPLNRQRSLFLRRAEPFGPQKAALFQYFGKVV